ncbi:MULTISPECIES: UdgX family uracil-DNA binding protein [unclassified Pseudoxanthomonas]|uniref:UdgX family uracil-DNA binding protein n=1 Tax=unclassified Pseudoxanthomonas TaxID=2645906 RepID=UPI003076FA37
MPRKRLPDDESAPLLAKPVDHIPEGSLELLREQAQDCRACPLWRNATQTVFGAGPPDARVMFIGEQPGSQEDIQGKPFVGPAGKLLHEALTAAGIDPATLYVTNTVKHFKYERSGKVRLHKRANAAEQAACRPWLAAEMLRLKPRLVVALGAMAAQTLFGNQFRLTQERGQWRDIGTGTRAMATWHPAALLRMRPPGREVARTHFFQDIAGVSDALRRKLPRKR